jgi:hypothetical protein
MYSSYSFRTSAVDAGEWSASRPVRALSPGKGPPVPVGQESFEANSVINLDEIRIFFFFFQILRRKENK